MGSNDIWLSKEHCQQNTKAGKTAWIALFLTLPFSIYALWLVRLGGEAGLILIGLFFGSANTAAAFLLVTVFFLIDRWKKPEWVVWRKLVSNALLHTALLLLALIVGGVALYARSKKEGFNFVLYALAGLLFSWGIFYALVYFFFTRPLVLKEFALDLSKVETQAQQPKE